MKFASDVSSSRRKNRRRHFTAGSSQKRKQMSIHLSKDLRAKYKVSSFFFFYVV
jgi:large subunit ribosomal protein L26e